MATGGLFTLSGRPPEQLGAAALAVFKARAPRAADAAAAEWQRKTVLLLSQKGNGRVYRFEFRMIGGRPVPMRHLPRPPHRASRPGEPPARDKGTFVRSIGWRLVDPFTRRLGSGDRRARWFERGTRWMRPRPWMQRSLSAAGPAMRIAIRRELARAG